MTDLLKQIDEGIGRHQERINPHWPNCSYREYCGCCGGSLPWPCETLKALQGWREAVLHECEDPDEHHGHAVMWAALSELGAAVGMPSPSDHGTDAVRVVLTRLREAVVEGERLKESLMDQRGHTIQAINRAEASEAQNRALVEALERIVAISTPSLVQSTLSDLLEVGRIARETLAQAKERG